MCAATTGIRYNRILCSMSQLDPTFASKCVLKLTTNRAVSADK